MYRKNSTSLFDINFEYFSSLSTFLSQSFNSFLFLLLDLIFTEKLSNLSIDRKHLNFWLPKEFPRICSKYVFKQKYIKKFSLVFLFESKNVMINHLIFLKNGRVNFSFQSNFN